VLNSPIGRIYLTTTTRGDFDRYIAWLRWARVTVFYQNKAKNLIGVKIRYWLLEQMLSQVYLRTAVYTCPKPLFRR